jgi:hypothetical protein
VFNAFSRIFCFRLRKVKMDQRKLMDNANTITDMAKVIEVNRYWLHFFTLYFFSLRSDPVQKVWSHSYDSERNVFLTFFKRYMYLGTYIGAHCPTYVGMYVCMYVCMYICRNGFRCYKNWGQSLQPITITICMYLVRMYLCV